MTTVPIYVYECQVCKRVYATSDVVNVEIACAGSDLGTHGPVPMQRILESSVEVTVPGDAA